MVEYIVVKNNLDVHTLGSVREPQGKSGPHFNLGGSDAPEKFRQLIESRTTRGIPPVVVHGKGVSLPAGMVEIYEQLGIRPVTGTKAFLYGQRGR